MWTPSVTNRCTPKSVAVTCRYGKHPFDVSLALRTYVRYDAVEQMFGGLPSMSDRTASVWTEGSHEDRGDAMPSSLSVHDGSRRTISAASGRRHAVRSRAERIRVAAEVAALVIITAALIAGPIVTRSHAQSFETASVLTSTGDTLWTIANRYPVPGLSTAESVEVISRLNGIESSSLSVGASILVPRESENLAVAMK